MNGETEFEMERKLVFKLWDVHHTRSRFSEGRSSQNRVLAMLFDHGAMPQNELTRRLEVKPGTASEVLGKLEANGLIHRSPDQSDRRTAEVRLTPKGRTVAEEAVKQRAYRHERMFQCFSEEEKQLLYSMLQRLTEHWKQEFLKE